MFIYSKLPEAEGDSLAAWFAHHVTAMNYFKGGKIQRFILIRQWENPMDPAHDTYFSALRATRQTNRLSVRPL